MVFGRPAWPRETCSACDSHLVPYLPDPRSNFGFSSRLIAFALNCRQHPFQIYLEQAVLIVLKTERDGVTDALLQYPLLFLQRLLLLRLRTVFAFPNLVVALLHLQRAFPELCRYGFEIFLCCLRGYLAPLI
jgi:hypothetical protein